MNSHNSLWGSCHTDSNGDVVEELIDDRSLYALIMVKEQDV